MERTLIKPIKWNNGRHHKCVEPEKHMEISQTEKQTHDIFTYMCVFAVNSVKTKLLFILPKRSGID